MLRIIIIAVLLYGAYVIGNYLSAEYKKADKASKQDVVVTAPTPPSYELPGLPPQLAPYLQNAQAAGPATLKKWLDANRKYLRDPALGNIELDYAVAVARQNSSEAKSVYAQVKARTPSNSPIQP